ncbi:MAG: hypothetical protein ACE5R6_16380 [Candidatus Heimdallarchaeota archaeon]
MTKLKTGIKRFDALVDWIEPGSQTILYGPNGTVKMVFAMHFFARVFRMAKLFLLT